MCDLISDIITGNVALMAWFNDDSWLWLTFYGHPLDTRLIETRLDLLVLQTYDW